ncbi:MAG TPA: antibiotic biosynthesis monooxygenase [Cellulomonadaceae bacterium]|nr:antibiotic biosynthesis monooxygenase [Cellulomonadaceae bacterium]
MRTTLIATFTARAGERATVTRLIADYAEVVRSEPGNERFEPFTDAADDHRFVVIESYRDDEAFAAHLGARAGADFNAELMHHIVEPASVLQFLRSVDA